MHRSIPIGKVKNLDGFSSLCIDLPTADSYNALRLLYIVCYIKTLMHPVALLHQKESPMNRSLETKPVAHALVWIALYIIIVNIGDAMGGIPNLSTSLLLTVLSVVLFFYSKTRIPMGFDIFSKSEAKTVLYYLPLGALVVIAYLGGVDPSLSFRDILIAVLLMANVGYLEELLFRGYLLEAIEQDKGRRRAVIISGITFGLGHIVNIFRGYEALELVAQITGAIAIGLVLALLVVKTRNLIPGMLFHILFNIGGTIIVQHSSREALLLLCIIGISVLYLLFLLKHLPTSQSSGYTTRLV